ncbi:MAG: FtsQ-type POTRA domain-containing protein [Candidatus Omnitrophica bacterium]|nr:FtsQ-type POTRA domain-containing protein [Candidatus Omnitrophota bacterium]
MGSRRRKKFKQLKKFKIKLNPVAIWTGSFLLIFLALFGSLGYAVYTSSIFKVGSETVQSNLKLSQEVRAKVEGESLFALNIQQIVNYILKENPEYKAVTILKKFPSTLIVNIDKRIAYAQIKGRRFFPLDEEGILIDEGSFQPFENLIVVEIGKDPRTFSKGYKLRSKNLDYAFELISSLKRSNIFNSLRVESINATQPEALYFIVNLGGALKESGGLDKKIKVIVGKNDFSRKLARFESVVNIKFKDKLDLIQYVDLRYKEVYVGFNR